ncbi:MAG: flagellar basal body-associated FliL family protein [Pseudomonadota bacterium]
MADEDENKETNTDDTTEQEDGVDDEDNEANKGKGKKKLIIIIVAAILVIIGGLFAAGMFDSKPKESKSTANQQYNNDYEDEEGIDGEYDVNNLSPELRTKEMVIELKEFIVNLRTKSSRPSFIKLTIALQYEGVHNTAYIEKSMTVLRDRIITFLRELRAEDVQGASGVYLIKEELLLRINKLLYPVVVKDILFKEILIQ